MVSSVAIDAFWFRVDKENTDSCWIFQGAWDKDRYGDFVFRSEGIRIKAHRFAWIISNGEIPQNKIVMHTCDNPPCVNIKHLKLGSRLDNMKDMSSKGRSGGLKTQTLCSRGHEFTEENTYIRLVQGRTVRQCRKCRLAYNRGYAR